MDNAENTIPELIKELSNRSEDVRWAAACALAKIGAPAVGPLIAALDNKDSVVRLRAAWALGRIGDQRAVEKLVKTLRDGDWSVRMRAAQALGHLRAHPALSALLLAMRDENADVRRHVIGALTRIADPASADRLASALKDKDWRIRMASALALSAIGDEKSRLFLKTAVCDENEYVRTIARTGTKTPAEETCRKVFHAGPVKELARGTMKAVQAGDTEILVANIDGKIHAIRNTCTHQGCKLSKGTLEGDAVRCACHGSVFDLNTGSVVKGPAKDPEPSYTVTIEDNEIVVRI
jgi:HEAT repeat protein/nitrite reductase/ring-hydroxylating ferredoxin subunit